MSVIKKALIKLLEYFWLEVTAWTATDMMEIKANTAILLYHQWREVISDYLEQDAQGGGDGAGEGDERYFGGARKDKRGRVAAGKVAVFGILK